MIAKVLVALGVVALARAQYGPIKSKGPKRTTTPFPPQQPDYSPDINAVAPYEENSGALSGAYGRPQSPVGAVSGPDNPWLSGVISSNAPAASPAYQPAPAPAYQPAPTEACTTPGYVCVLRHQCQGGVITAPGTGSNQCDARSEVCCQLQQPRPAYQPQPQPQPAYRPQPQPQPQPAYRPQPQPQPSYRPAPAPAPAPAYQPQPAYQQPAYQPQPASRPYQPAAPIGGSIYDSQAPPSQPRPVPNYSSNSIAPSYVTEAPYQKYTGPLNTTPHPGCAAALKCVEEVYCTWDGVMSDVPQAFSREQAENKVPLSDCQNIETGIIGKCCRDPNYKDPWPAGMMMNSGPFDDGLYHPGVQHSGGSPGPQQPAYAAPQPAYAPQPQPFAPQPQPYAPQPQPFAPQPQPQYTPNAPAYAPQPQPAFNSRPAGTQIQRITCGPSANCVPHNICPGDRLTQPGKPCRVPNDDSTGVCCSKLQFPQNTNNQQYKPPSSKPQVNPYFAPKPQPNPYNPPKPAQQPTPYNPPKPAQQPAPYNPTQPAQTPAPYNPPKPAPNPYNQPNPAQQPTPYNPPQSAQIPVPNSPLKPVPAPNPYNPAKPAQEPSQAPAPYSPPNLATSSFIPPPPAQGPAPYNPSKPSTDPYSPPKPAPQPSPSNSNPYNAPRPTQATPIKPESSNDIAPQPNVPAPAPETPTTPQLATTQPPPIYRPRPTPPPAEVRNSAPAQPEPEPGKDCGVRRQVSRPNGPAGLETGFGEFPWQAQVLRSSNQSPICSAAILAENIVVTAAHCVSELDAPSILVKAGDWKLASENPGEEPKPVQIRGVTAIAVHPEFEPISQVNDMAVLILDTPLAFDQHVDKLCLGKDSAPGQPPSGTNCVVTGWGKAATKGNVAGSTLHSIPVSFMPNQQCQDAFRKTNLGKYFQLHSSFTCALPSSPNHDLCQVDAGSPIACQKPDGNYELSGIYSWDVGCHPNTNVPAAMSKVDNQWVQSVMDKPIEEIKKETEEEKQRQGSLGQTAAEIQAAKPGFSQGYGK